MLIPGPGSCADNGAIGKGDLIADGKIGQLHTARRPAPALGAPVTDGRGIDLSGGKGIQPLPDLCNRAAVTHHETGSIVSGSLPSRLVALPVCCSDAETAICIEGYRKTCPGKRLAPDLPRETDELAASAALRRLAQARPGDILRFRRIDREEAGYPRATPDSETSAGVAIRV